MESVFNIDRFILSFAEYIYISIHCITVNVSVCTAYMHTCIQLLACNVDKIVLHEMLHGDGRALQAIFKRMMENKWHTATAAAAALWLLQLLIEIRLNVGRTDSQTNTHTHSLYKCIAIECVHHYECIRERKKESERERARA